ncbi:MAG: hypothetical protein CMK32_12390 [Porticoccaceae bacterium]|nr:hypothetical protein [Porticoccaceae bacterium]
MKNRVFNSVLLAMVCWAPVWLAAADFELPAVECNELAEWAATLDQGQMFTPRPGLELNTLFADKHIVPLFGISVLQWQRDHFRELGAMMNTCRREMYATDRRPAGDALYAVMKVSREVTSAMQNLWTAQTRVKRQIDKLVEQPPSPELAGIFDMATQALQGEDVMDRVQDQQPRYQGLARQVAQMSQYALLLDQETVEAYLTRLKSKRGAAAKELAEEQAAFDAVLQQIAAIPLTDAGYTRLKQISHNTDRSALTREQLAIFNAAMTQKTQAIREAQAAGQARAQAEAARPIDLAPRLQELLDGDRVRTLTIAGLRPGMNQDAAIQHVQRRLGLVPSTNPIDSAQFAVSRENASRFRAERRTGPRVSLEDAGEKVGQVIYEEFFRASVIPQSARQWLVHNLGQPDATVAVSGGTKMTWRDRDKRLQVLVTNSLEVVWKGAGYEGRLLAALWSRDYEQHLDEVNERCDDLRDKPRNAWSMNDSRYFAEECPLMPGARKTPGLK